MNSSQVWKATCENLLQVSCEDLISGTGDRFEGADDFPRSSFMLDMFHVRAETKGSKDKQDKWRRLSAFKKKKKKMQNVH